MEIKEGQHGTGRQKLWSKQDRARQARERRTVPANAAQTVAEGAAALSGGTAQRHGFSVKSTFANSRDIP
jgi:hypothetical protein